MIDTDKYEGHTLESGMNTARLLEHLNTEPNRRLIADAPLLLAEVERLRLAIENVASFPKRVHDLLRLEGVIDAMVCMLREAIE